MKSAMLIIFDIDDVLLDRRKKEKYFVEKTHRLLRKNKLNIKKSEFDSAWKEICKIAAPKGMSLSEMRSVLFKKLSIPQSLFEEYENIDKKSLKLIKPMEKHIASHLEKLKRSGYTVVALSNTVYSSKEKGKMLEFAGLGNTMEKIFVANEIRHRKPEKAAYRAVLDYFGVRPSDAIFVGHDKGELLGAKRAGIRTISYRGYKKVDFYAGKFSQILKYAEIMKQ